jgi:hypothetical protein
MCASSGSSSPYATNKRALKMMDRLKADVVFDTDKRRAATPAMIKVGGARPSV